MTLRVGWTDDKGCRQVRDYENDMWDRLTENNEMKPVIQDIWMVEGETDDEEVLVYQRQNP